MENLSYIIVILILINSLFQFGLIFRYYYPLVIEYFNNKKISWNSNYDRIILASFTVFFYLSLYFSQILLNSSNEFYFIILYLIILIFLTILIFLIQKIGVAERIKNNSILTTETTIKSFKHLLNEYQLVYLFNEFKKNEYINADFMENNFSKKFLQEKIKLSKKVSAVVLYHVYNNLIENIKVDKELTLKNFVPFFLSYKGEAYNYNSVKNGSQSEYSKEIEIIERIFQQIPK